MYTIRRACMIGFGLLAVLGGCAPVGPGGASDVPWLKPDAFSSEGVSLLARLETDGSGVLLLTHQSIEQRSQDWEDGVLGNGPHEGVYRLNPSTTVFELAGDEAWDNSDGPVSDCGGSGSRPSPLTSSGGLDYQGRPIRFHGRALIDVRPAPYSPAVAALTSEGRKSILYLPTGGAAGQHYHQLFSEVDGKPLGQPVRIPLITSEAHHRICWTRDERYVIYSQSSPYDVRIYDLLAVVPVAEEVALANGGGASDVPCLRPTAWFYMEGTFLLRPATEGSDTLLLTHENGQQHGPVYRLDPSTEDFELVDDEVWDTADGTVTDCRDNQYRPVAFTVTEDHRLTFDGQPIEVAGGSVAYTFGVPDRPAVAVLSTDGLPYDFETHHGFTGQYYHQLFSEIDGRPLGEPLRVAVGGARKFVQVCWTEDERFVVYHQDLYSRADHRSFLCVVPLADELAQLEDEESP